MTNMTSTTQPDTRTTCTISSDTIVASYIPTSVLLVPLKSIADPMTLGSTCHSFTWYLMVITRVTEQQIVALCSKSSVVIKVQFLARAILFPLNKADSSKD